MVKKKPNLASMILVLLVVSLLAIGMIAGCSGSSDDGGSGGAATLTGTVKSESTGAVIAGATVAINDTTTTTDNNGTYIFQDLSMGTYTLAISMTGYQTYQVSITLIEGSNIKNATLTPEITPTATVSGTVTLNNTAVDGVTVQLTGTGEDTTDVEGVYGFINVAYGTYTITATKTGYSDYSGQVEVNAATVTHNIAVAVSQDLPVPEEGKGHISGYVYDENGDPLKNVECTLYNIGSSKEGERLLIVYTDANGRYIYLNVDPASYQILFKLGGFIIPSTIIVVDSGNVGEPPPAPGTPDDPPVDSPNPASTLLTGTVSGPIANGNSRVVIPQDGPIANVQVTIDPLGAAIGATTNAQGVYLFTNPPTGNQAIRAEKFGYQQYNDVVNIVPNQTTVKNITMNQNG